MDVHPEPLEFFLHKFIEQHSLANLPRRPVEFGLHPLVELDDVEIAPPPRSARSDQAHLEHYRINLKGKSVMVGTAHASAIFPTSG